MLDIVVEQLCFIDEFIFKQQSYWRFMIYDSIEKIVRWYEDMRRDDIHNILSIYIVDDYLSCIDIKNDFYNIEKFY